VNARSAPLVSQFEILRLESQGSIRFGYRVGVIKLEIIENLFLAPSKNDNVAVQSTYILFLALNFNDIPFQAEKRRSDNRQNLYSITDFEA